MSDRDYSMDRPRSERQWLHYRKYLIISVVVVAILAIVGFYQWQRRNASFVNADDYLFATVQQGEFLVTVEAVGTLEPIVEEWVVARVHGTVERIIAEQGKFVRVDEPLIELSSDHVEEALDAARLALIESENQVAAENATRQSTLLNYEAGVLRAETTHEEAKLRLLAETELYEKGGQSGIDFESTKLRERQARGLLERERALLKTYQESVMVAGERISNSRLQTARNNLQRAEANHAALLIKSPLEGTLRETLVERGANVAQGNNVARVAVTDKLIGVVQVPAHRADELNVDQTAQLLVLGQEIAGTVRRVAPVVREGTVEVELRIDGALPAGTRPELVVQASITVSENPNALFVRRPHLSQDHSFIDVFRLDDEEKVATRTRVKFGAGAVRDIAIEQGLKEGDRIVLGNLERFDESDTIKFW